MLHTIIRITVKVNINYSVNINDTTKSAFDYVN